MAPLPISLVALGAAFGILIALAIAVWGWGTYLDQHEHDPARIRRAMYFVVATCYTCELYLGAAGVVRAWVLALSLFVTVWGSVDAILRFPAMHEIESFFSLKQFMLLVLKTLAYAFGMSPLSQCVPLFLAVLFLGTWSMPLFYCMAFPMDPAEQVAVDDAHDVDLVVRVWRLAACPVERRTCAARCRVWWYRKLTAVSETSTVARMAIGAASSHHRRAFKRVGRSV